MDNVKVCINAAIEPGTWSKCYGLPIYSLYIFESFMLGSVFLNRIQSYSPPVQLEERLLACGYRLTSFWDVVLSFTLSIPLPLPPQPNKPLDRSRSLKIPVEYLTGSELRGRKNVATDVGSWEHKTQVLKATLRPRRDGEIWNSYHTTSARGNQAKWLESKEFNPSSAFFISKLFVC
jgi:hypothetical protein